MVDFLQYFYQIITHFKKMYLWWKNNYGVISRTMTMCEQWWSHLATIIIIIIILTIIHNNYYSFFSRVISKFNESINGFLIQIIMQEWKWEPVGSLS